VLRASCEGLGSPGAPCPYASCRHHLYSGEGRWAAFEALLDEREPNWPYTCSIAVAHDVDDALPGQRIGAGKIIPVKAGNLTDRGNLALADVGRHLGCSGERARQLEAQALAKAAQSPVLAEAMAPDPTGTAEEWAALEALVLVDRSSCPVGGAGGSTISAPFEGWSW
jgi:hypothetical protein